MNITVVAIIAKKENPLQNSVSSTTVGQANITDVVMTVAVIRAVIMIAAGNHGMAANMMGLGAITRSGWIKKTIATKIQLNITKIIQTIVNKNRMTITKSIHAIAINPGDCPFQIVESQLSTIYTNHYFK